MRRLELIVLGLGTPGEIFFDRDRTVLARPSPFLTEPPNPRSTLAPSNPDGLQCPTSQEHYLMIPSAGASRDSPNQASSNS